jgi:aspartyl protease family protein
MMTNDLMLGGVYLLMAIMLIVGALMARREPAAKMVTMALAWIAIFAAGFVLFTFRDNLGWVAQRLKAEAVGTPVEEGKETRIPMAIDGHFWVAAKLNGHDVKFLVDSGATTTTIDRDTAKAAGVEVSGRRDQYVRTGNGVIRVSSGRADELTVGTITRRDVGLEIADNDNLNVLGMNYLSSLSRWGVEGRWLVLALGIGDKKEGEE